MTSKLWALVLLIFTAGTVGWYSIQPSVGGLVQPPITGLPSPNHPLSNTPPLVEAVFVLDTTGSMGGLIQAAKDKIWSIATTMASAQPAPKIRIGLVAYRDRGEQYVTKVVGLTEDLDSMYAALMDFKAQGGGDGPESVNQALYDAVHKVSWSQDESAYKVVFLVGDAPPHMDYQDDVKYPETLRVAKQKGIIVNAIQAGKNSATNHPWLHIAALGSGQYFQVGQQGSAVAISTPFDARMAELSKKVEDTRLFYGNDEDKKKQKNKQVASEKLHASASDAVRARRAMFNASSSGKANLYGEKELLGDLAAGNVELSEIDSVMLPEAMQRMESVEEKEAYLETMNERRTEANEALQVLSKKRTDYLKKEVEKKDGVKDSLDVKLFGAIRAQSKTKGLVYEENSLVY